MRKADLTTTKSGYLNFLEPSGPLQVCNGTALPLPLVAVVVAVVVVVLINKDYEKGKSINYEVSHY